MLKPTIGLEIHIEAKTETKMFCGCLNDPEEITPNKNICPVCTGQPGALPVANKTAIDKVVALGFALHADIPQKAKFDRKNYFYPDLPKGYQISQYDEPFCLNGYLDIPNGKKIRLTRIHLEEDTARLSHDEIGKSSLVDFNRSSVPLIELVTEPDIESGEEAVAFAKELQRILRYMDISDAEMERGQMRVEVNISLGENGKLGTKVEIKNLNSFRVVYNSVEYEIKRQTELLENGGKVVQETRGWSEPKQATVSQRIKEEAHDYRYFPEPDLPPIEFSENDLESIKASVPELPADKRKRFMKQFGLSSEQADVVAESRGSAQYFEETVSEFFTDEKLSDGKESAIQTVYNYLTSDLKGLMNESTVSFKDLKISPENLADLAELILDGEISSRLAKDILAEMFVSGLDPRQIMKEKGWKQVSDKKTIVLALKEVIEENPVAVADYKKGKENTLQFMIGQAMKKLKGQGNPEVIKEELKKYLTSVS